MIKNLFRIKPLITSEDERLQTRKLKPCLTAIDVILLGVGAIIGAGIFVLTGIAAATKAGPAIVISYVVAGAACAFAALSYAELAAGIGGCGSAYGYAYAGLGEIIAWIIGWDLILEYSVSVATVAVGWSGYVNNVLMAFGVSLPNSLLTSPFRGGICNLPAMLIIFIVAALLITGVKISARFNGLMVMIKLVVIALFIAIAASHITPSNWHPFMPFGWQGVMSGAALIFFAYIGFDAVSTSAEEVINPQRNMPIGIIVSLIICTLLYLVVAGLLTGIVPYQTLNVSSPISAALLHLGFRIAAGTIAVGALAGLTTVILVMYYGLTRIFFAMARDHLLPAFFSKLAVITRTPVRAIIMSGVVMMLFSAIIPMSDLAELVNIGTLFAFNLVCAAVIILRYTKPHLPRPFKTPFNPLVPGLGITFCTYLMFSLPMITWVRFFTWMILGLVVYFGYSRHRSLLARK